MGSVVLPAVHPLLPAVPTQRTHACLLCCCRVLGAFGQGRGASAGHQRREAEEGLAWPRVPVAHGRGKDSVTASASEHHGGWWGQPGGPHRAPLPSILTAVS